MADADAPNAAAMASEPSPTEVQLPEIEQQPELAGTLLRAEHFIGPDLRLQAMTDGTFCLVTSAATTPVDRTTYGPLLIGHSSKPAASISSGRGNRSPFPFKRKNGRRD